MPDDSSSRRADDIEVLRRAARILRDESRPGVIDESAVGPFVRNGAARLLDAVAEAMDNGQLPDAVEQSALVLARHAVNRM